MKKIISLIKVLRKCGNSNKKRELDYGIVLLITVCIAIAGGLAWAGYRFNNVITIFAGKELLLPFLIFAAGVFTIIVSFPSVITHLYMSSDLSELLTLPISPRKIAIAKVIVVSLTNYVISFIVIVPMGVSYAIASPCGLKYWLVLILGAILTPNFSLIICTIISVIIMTVFKFFRNKDRLKIIGIILIAIFTCLYYIYVVPNSGKPLEKFIEKNSIAPAYLIDRMHRFFNYYPLNIGLQKIFTGSIAKGLTISIVMTVLLTVLLFILLDKCYISGALKMQDTSSSNKLKINTRKAKKNSIVKCIAIQDFIRIKRNPAYLYNGFIAPFLLPVLMIFAFARPRKEGSIYTVIEMALKKSDINQIFAATVFIGILIGLYTSIIATMTNTISDCSFSREGKTFEIFKQYPIEISDYFKGKRIVAYVTGTIPIIIITLASDIILIAKTIIPIWIIVYSIVISILSAIALLNLKIMIGARKINLNWDNEAKVAKGNGGSILMSFVAITISIVFLYEVFYLCVSTQILDGKILLILSLLLFGLFAFATSKISEKYCIKKLKGI